MVDYQHSLLSYHPLSQLVPRIKITVVLQCVAGGSCWHPLTGERFQGV